MNAPENRYLYFGDLDYEGIGIYERLSELFEEDHEILPFRVAYERMLGKAAACAGRYDLPDTKEGQNRKLSGRFFSCFPEQTAEQMRQILEAGQYIPQEILNILDF